MFVNSHSRSYFRIRSICKLHDEMNRPKESISNHHGFLSREVFAKFLTPGGAEFFDIRGGENGVHPLIMHENIEYVLGEKCKHKEIFHKSC